jgi:hypothetical protein
MTLMKILATTRWPGVKWLNFYSAEYSPMFAVASLAPLGEAANRIQNQV